MAKVATRDLADSRYSSQSGTEWLSHEKKGETMTKEDAINIFKEQFCGLEVYCEIHRDGLCLTDDCEIWWAIKALEQYKADAVEVVRCKDCKYFDSGTDEDGKLFFKCLGWVYGGTSEDDFCSHGERRDG